MNRDDPSFHPLPLSRRVEPLLVLSLLLTLATACTSLLGIFNTSLVYPSEELQKAFRVNDIVNLFIGVPFLLGIIWAARRQKLNGVLYWPGVLLYVLYNHIAYLIAMPQVWATIAHALIVGLTAYTVSGLFKSIDGQQVQDIAGKAMPAKFAGGVLTGLGLIFVARASGVLVEFFNGSTLSGTSEIATSVADCVLALIWIIGGVALWRRRSGGYKIAPALLLNMNLLFLALIALMIIQTLTTDGGYGLTDFIVIIAMALVCLAPLVIYIHNIREKGTIK